MTDILELQITAGVEENNDDVRVSTLSIIPPCPGWPSTVTFGHC